MPKVEPTSIEPGNTAVVEVDAKPPEMGEKTVEFTLETDSKLTPIVKLHLRLIGMRRPPFLLKVQGDLTYLEDLRSAQPREIEVLTVETGPPAEEPKVVADLSFLDFERVRVQEGRYSDPGTILRTYMYLVRLKSSVPAGTLTGVVSVKSPWDEHQALSIPFYARESHRFRVFPTHLSLDRAADPSRGNDAEARFFILLNDPSLEQQFEFIQPAGEPFLIEPRQAGRTERLIPFTVRRRPGASAIAGEPRITVRTKDSADSQSFTVSARVPGREIP